ncbi:MAG: hypothetical protein M1816_001101 [Peltula sp. TS41687]|nr:MAG: hypothetical protein M1816_001101 [Peltula sp. TS41687]
MRLSRVRWCTLFFLLVHIEDVKGRRSLGLRPRADDVPTSSAAPLPTVSAASSASTRIPNSPGTQSSLTSSSPDPSQSAQPEASSRLRSESESVTASTTSPASSTMSSTTSSVASTAVNGLAPSATSGPSSTGPNLLPLPPRITPGLAIAGVILIVTGTAYALIGIKNKWLHIPLSSAFLTSLAVTVLIIYVMNPPVSKGVQGAFVVATFITGVIFGALSLIFPEITEGLGCLLGGFCLGMWLLALKPGGLLTSSGAKGIFIAAFCVGVYALSFSHYTRPYGLIASTSLAGGTAVVMGIDCFSRAGLKEFWLYLWALNKDVFPLGTDTYPHTRGIRVELAGIIFIFILGIISQLKLWKVVQDRRRQKLADRQKAERDLDEAEEAVGRRIVEDSSRDRLQWEATYGDRPRSYRDQVDSGIGEDFESVRKGSTSIINTREVGEMDGDGIELSQLHSSKRPTPADMGPERQVRETRPKSVTVRLVSDEDAESRILGKEEEDNVILGHPSTSMTGRYGSVRISSTPMIGDANSAHLMNNDGRVSVAPGPAIVPLPFTVPVAEDLPVAKDGSSTATRADSIYAPADGSQAADSSLSRQRSFDPGAVKRPEIPSASQEALLVPHIEDDDASSIAATIDNMSDFGSSPLLEPSKRLDPVPDKQDSALVKLDEGMTDATLDRQDQDIFRDPESKADSDSSFKETPDSDYLGEHRVSTKLPSSSSTSIHSASASPATPSSIQEHEPLMIPLPSSVASSQGEANESVEESEAPDVRSFPIRRSKHRTSSTAISEPPNDTAKSGLQGKRQRVSLSGQLPKNVSKVVMCYRTNEWAKHVTQAEKPELEELEVTEDGVALAEAADPPALAASGQSTPENAQPKPSNENTETPGNSQVPQELAHSSSHPSLIFTTENRQQPLSRTVSSNTTTHPTLNNQQRITSRSSLSNNPFMKSSVQSTRVLSQPQVNLSRALRSVSTPIPRQSPFDSPAEIQATAATNGGRPNTLLAQRENQIRTRYSSSSLNLNQHNSTLAPVPELEINPSDSISLSDQNSPRIIDDDNMSLSERKELLQHQQQQYQPASQHRAIPPPQSKPYPYDSHQPKRHSDTPVDPRRREAMLAQWRQSLRDDSTGANTAPHVWAEAHRAERMRKGDMLDAHREAIRRMQAVANSRFHKGDFPS